MNAKSGNDSANDATQEQGGKLPNYAYRLSNANVQAVTVAWTEWRRKYDPDFKILEKKHIEFSTWLRHCITIFGKQLGMNYGPGQAPGEFVMPSGPDVQKIKSALQPPLDGLLKTPNRHADFVPTRGKKLTLRQTYEEKRDLAEIQRRTSKINDGVIGISELIDASQRYVCNDLGINFDLGCWEHLRPKAKDDLLKYLAVEKPPVEKAFEV